MLSIILHISGCDEKRSRNMRNVMRLLKSQTYSNYELIVIEQSVDDQKYWQRETKRAFPKRLYKAIYHTEWCGAWCRNVGARIASGDVLLFLDADTIFGDDYLDQIMKSFVLDMGYMLPYITGLRLNEKGAIAYLNGAHYTKLDDSMITNTFTNNHRKACGAAMVMSRECFDNIGGYNETLTVREDKDIAIRLLVYYDQGHLNTMRYIVGDLPHGKRKPQIQYIEMVYKYMTWDRTATVTQVLKEAETGCEERTIIDWLYYLFTRQIRYIEKVEITLREWMSVRNMIVMITDYMEK